VAKNSRFWPQATGHGGSREEASTPVPHPQAGHLTCAHTSLAEQQRQALHLVEGAEVVHVLVQPIHTILVLWEGLCEAEPLLPNPSSPPPQGPFSTASTLGGFPPNPAPCPTSCRSLL
jgi:hypothetical protein